MRFIFLIFYLMLSSLSAYCQHYNPTIEWTKPVPADARLIVKSGYLVVPENRQKPAGRTVKLPFYFIRRPDQHPTQNISLYMVGGPGYSTTAGIDSIGYEFGYLKFGGTIMFGQRGTKTAQPCLECSEVDEAIRQSLRKGLSRDSLVLAAVEKCRKKLTANGIDLSSYTTIESAEDINDLRIALKLDSLNLIGLSYSGGLMMTVARNHPEAVKTLILRSPLPGFVNYDEHALINFNEALEQVFKNIRQDSTNQQYYDLRQRFHNYFTAISDKHFYIKYLEKGTSDSLSISYSKSELLEVINDRLSNGEMTGTPEVMLDMINGKTCTLHPRLTGRIFRWKYRPGVGNALFCFLLGTNGSE